MGKTRGLSLDLILKMSPCQAIGYNGKNVIACPHRKRLVGWEEPT